MNDAYYELLVARKHRSLDVLIKAVTIAAIVVLILIIPLFGILAMFAAAILGVAAYFLIFPKLDIEYEYSLVNHDLEIDVIYCKRKRKQLITLDLRQAEIIAPASSHRLDSYQRLKRIDYSAGDTSQTPYAMVIPKQQEMVCILIQLDDVMENRLRGILPRIFFVD
ncbi:MAG: hypothetical protein HFH53_05005 [Hespellia sp.]|nr:hypothetical protein [Hespellia sp.]